MIFSVVVTYNPELQLLNSQYLSMEGQVDGIVYVDNNSTKLPCFPKKENVFVIRNTKNLGLGRAQNQGIEYAISKGADYILLLDQDSELGIGMTECLKKEFETLKLNGSEVGLVSPIKESAFNNLISNETIKLSLRLNQTKISSVTEVAYTIASGMFFHKDLYAEIGGMSELLFIDAIDLEWCCRARSYGFKVFVTPHTKLFHRLGNGESDRIRSHSPLREYFITRNDVYLSKLKHIPFGYRLRKCITPFIRLTISLFRLNYDYLKSEIRGIYNGLRL